MTGQSTQQQGAMDTAREHAQEQAHKAADQARDMADTARERARDMIGQRSTQLAEQADQQAGDMRAAAEQLRQQGKDGPAKVAEQTADRMERLGGYLRDSDADRLVSDVERMARSNPWAVVVGGVALGFAASRVLKASSRERYRASQPPESTQIPRTTGTSDGNIAAPRGVAAPPPPVREPVTGVGASGASPEGTHVGGA